MVPWNAARAKVQIRLSIQRLRTLQEKKLALAKKSRREIADLVAKGRIETARLRVEGLIQDDIYVELLELLELYSEKLQARFNLLDVSSGPEPEPSISDAVCSIVYAAPRTELKELQVLREILMHKYGRPFALALQQAEPAPESVPARVVSKLALYTPARELVDAYLFEIAQGYGVAWAPDPGRPDVKVDDEGKDEEADDVTRDGNGGGPGEGQQKEPVGVLEPTKGPAPASETTVVKTTAGAEKDGRPGGTGTDATAGTGKAPKKLNEEEELALRFDRLKNLR